MMMCLSVMFVKLLNEGCHYAEVPKRFFKRRGEEE